MTTSELSLMRRGSRAQREAWDVAVYWWGNSCAYGDKPAWLWEHVLTHSRGGLNVAANIVPACGVCNRNKYDRLVAEFLFSHWETLAKIVIYQFVMEHLPAEQRLSWLVQHGRVFTSVVRELLEASARGELLSEAKLRHRLRIAMLPAGAEI